MRPRVSVLIPAKDEAGNLPPLLAQCAETVAAHPDWAWEVVVIDDGSADGSWELLGELQARYPFLRRERHRTQRGIAEALRTGWLAAGGDILVFWPADLQFRPADLPRLVQPIVADGWDMVTGYKQGAYDKAFVSSVYNRLTRALFRLPVRDLNNVKAYRREVMAAMTTRPDWHRYMVVVAAAQGFSVTEVPVPVYPRHAGVSKFGWSRIPVGVLDLLAVWFELRVAPKPLLLFGLLGAALFAVGVLAGTAALVWLLVRGEGVRAVWTVVQTCLILGSVFFATGLLGEQVAAQRAELREVTRRLDEARRAPRNG